MRKKDISRHVSPDEKRRCRLILDERRAWYAPLTFGMSRARSTRMLRDLAGFSRHGMAYLLNVSHETIARYERNKPPRWYVLLLRFLCGDLSPYGYGYAQLRVDVDTGELEFLLSDDGRTVRAKPAAYNGIINEQVRLYQNIATIEQQRSQALAQEVKYLQKRLRFQYEKVSDGKVVPLFPRPRNTLPPTPPVGGVLGV